MNIDADSIISEAEELLDVGEFDRCKKLLEPLVEKSNPKAIRLFYSIFDNDVSDEERERIYVEGMFKAADLGDLEALYIVGSFYDLGEHIQEDKAKASSIFKEAADRGHAHSQWIHACELLWGLGSYAQNVEAGLEYLEKAISAKSGEACITKARLYHEGEFDFPKNSEKVQELCELAVEYDETVFVPYT